MTTPSVSKVYFADFRTSFRENLTQKLKRLMKAAGFNTLPLEGKFAAIKMHFGEAGNLAFLRPNYARAVAEMVTECGGKPFLTDANTLYVGGRKNALDHLDTAYLNGFSPLAAGCHVIIADGLKGNDDVEVPVNGTHVKNAKIGRAIMDADVFISLTHFKGHEMMGIGGAVKNIGMGSGSRAGKLEMHSSGKPMISAKRCVGCAICQRICAHEALVLEDGKMRCDHNRCAGCGRCLAICPKDAIHPAGWDSAKLLDERTAEYALAVVQNRPCFHISIICDVSPNCDCHPENDAPIIPNIGMLASMDPVALDVACCDLCQKAPRLSNTALDGQPVTEDIFHDNHPDTRWQDAVEHAVKIGLGSDKYELVKI